MSNIYLQTWMPIKKSGDKKIITICAVFYVDNNMNIISHVPADPNTGNLLFDFEMTININEERTPKKWIVLQPEVTLQDDYDTLPANHKSAVTLVTPDGIEDSGSINTSGAPIL